jgi:Transposase
VGFNAKEHEMKEEHGVYVGIDWADRKNVYALRVKGDEKIRLGSFTQGPAGIEEFVSKLSKLRQLSKGTRVAVALEQSKGALVFALMKHDFIVLYPLNPNSFAKYREAWVPSRAKDDPTDAVLILEMLDRAVGSYDRGSQSERRYGSFNDSQNRDLRF